MKSPHQLPFLLLFLAIVICPTPTTADTWPDWRGSERDGIWRETNLINSFPEEGLKRAWTAEIGAGYGGPTVAEDHVYLMDRGIDPQREEERVLCFDRHTGALVWEFAYPCVYHNVSYDLGPRAAVVIHEGVAFSMGTMGDLYALNAQSGEKIWKRQLVEEFQAEVPTWGVSAAPLIVDGKVLVQSGGNEGPLLLALDAENGEEIWRAPADRMTYATPVVPPAAPDTVLVWTDSRLTSVKIDNGEVVWTYHAPKEKDFAARVQSPVFNAAGDAFLLTDFNEGTWRFDHNGEEWSLTWHVRGRNERNTEGLHALMGAPLWIDDHFYGVDAYGQFRGLRAEDSSRVWETDRVVPQGRWATVFPVRQGETGNLVWIANELGELILCELTPQGYREIDRTQLIEPTQEIRQRDYKIVWSHPAFAHRHIYARNDKVLIAISVAADGPNDR